MTPSSPAFVGGTRAVLLDVFDTVLSIDFRVVHEALALASGVAADHWESGFAQHGHDVMRGTLTPYAAFETIFAAAGVSAPDIDALLAHEAELHLAHVELYPDTVPFLQELRRRGVIVALVSNCAPNAGPLLEALGLHLHADHVLLSCDVGSIKPEADIFHTALAAVGVDASETLFVDDQPAYCAGAEAVGIRTVQISRRTPAAGAVSSLTDVLALL